MLTILIGFILYLVGIKIIFTIAVLYVLYNIIPTLGILHSKTSRLVSSIFVYYAFIQVAASAQFLVIPNSGFNGIALLLCLILIISILALRKFNDTQPKIKMFNLQDKLVLIVLLIFLVPFIVLSVKNGYYETISKIGSIQVVDSAVHYDSIGLESTRGGYKYDQSYYPRGFHVATSFIQEDMNIIQHKMSWKSNAIIYSVQYIIFATLLIYSVIYLSNSYFKKFYAKNNKNLKVEYLALCLSLAIPLLLLYLYLFVQQGFLNYFYVAATILFASVLLLNKSDLGVGEQIISKKWSDKIPLIMFILISIGASFSWPIFTPVIVLLLTVGIISVNTSLKNLTEGLFQFSNLPLIILLFFHFLALYFQIHYDTKNGLEATGALSSFNILLYIVFLIAIIALYSDLNIREKLRVNILNTVIPYILLVTFLMLIQYYMVGEARYYLIKSSIIVELILFCIFFAYITFKISNNSINKSMVIYLPVLSAFLIMTTVGFTKAPFIEVRSLFRSYSNISYPEYFDEDINNILPYAINDKLADFNMIVLHVNKQGNLYSHAEISRWFNSMGVTSNSRATCFYKSFNELAYAPESGSKDMMIYQNISDCSKGLDASNKELYIFTDSNSAGDIKSRFNKFNNVNVVF
jgi:hypothetical protein